MRKYTFPYGGSFGKGDSWENTVDVELTNKGAARLEDSARKGSRRRLDEDPEIADIHDKVYKAAYNHELRCIPDFILDEIRRDEYDDDERISNRKIAKQYLEDSTFSVSYPEELQNLKR